MSAPKEEYQWLLVGKAEGPTMEGAIASWISTLWGNRKLAILAHCLFELDSVTYSAALVEGVWEFRRKCLKPAIEERYLRFSPKELNPEA